MTVEEFQALLDRRGKFDFKDQIEFEIELNGKWGWRNYKTYLYNFGWCIYPVDDEAKLSLKKAGRWIHCCFAKVYKKDGTYEEIQIPAPVFDDYKKNTFWFEYGKTTRKQFEREVASYNKRHQDIHKTIVSFNADEIPQQWWEVYDE